jgi:hypothetical protein
VTAGGWNIVFSTTMIVLVSLCSTERLSMTASIDGNGMIIYYATDDLFVGGASKQTIRAA